MNYRLWLQHTAGLMKVMKTSKLPKIRTRGETILLILRAEAANLKSIMLGYFNCYLKRVLYCQERTDIRIDSANKLNKSPITPKRLVFATRLFMDGDIYEVLIYAKCYCAFLLRSRPHSVVKQHYILLQSFHKYRAIAPPCASTTFSISE